MRVLLTGSSGFIGAAIDEQLTARGDEVVRVDALIPQAHPADVAVPEGVHRVDVRDAGEWADLLDGVDAVCHQAAMVGAGVTVSDLPLYAAHNDLGTAALLAAMHEREVDALVLASSMVVYGEGRYACEEHGEQPTTARSRAALDSGDFENHCPLCDRPLSWQLVPEDALLDPRSSYAASKLAQEHYTSSWVRQAGARAIGLRYHNVYGPGMPRDTPYSGVAAIFRSSLEHGRPPRVFEDGGQMRDFVHVHDVARRQPARARRRGRPAGRVVVGVQRLLGDAGPDPSRRGDPRRGLGRSRPRRSPATTAPATSATSSPHPSSPPPTSASPPRSPPTRASPSSPPPPSAE